MDVASSYQVYQWLRNNDRFAVVHFHDGRGLGYYTLLAQKQRLSCLHAHVLVSYAADGPLAEEAAKTGFKGALVTDIDVLRRDFMLRRSVELAETAIVADAGLLNKARAAHWTLPPSTTMVLADAPLHAAPAATTTGAIKELVFLGDLNAASGLQVFMDAIDQLVLLGRTVLPSKITFVGQVDTMNDFASDELIEMRAFSWNIRYTIQSSLAGQDVVDYVRSGPGRLAVVPALHKSGASRLAHQLVLAGAPVIAAHEYGSESALPASVLFVGNSTAALVAQLQRVLAAPTATVATPVRTAADLAASWSALYEDLLSKQHMCALVSVPAPGRTPLVSVVLVHHDRPELLKQAIASLEAQTFTDFEVILVDDGSTEPASIEFLNDLSWQWWEKKGWKVLREPNRYLGAARNTGARHARGRYVLFMDDDDIAKPHQIATYVRVALATQAEVVTSGHDLFDSADVPTERSAQRRYVPLGAATYVGMLENCFGDSNMFVAADFFRSFGGFTEDYGVGFEDYEFLAKVVLKGRKLEVVSEPLHWYRSHQDSMSMTTDLKAGQARFMRAYVAVYPTVNDDFFQALLRFTREKFFARDVQRRFVSELTNTTVISTTGVQTSTLSFSTDTSSSGSGSSTGGGGGGGSGTSTSTSTGSGSGSSTSTGTSTGTDSSTTTGTGSSTSTGTGSSTTTGTGSSTTTGTGSSTTTGTGSSTSTSTSTSTTTGTGSSTSTSTATSTYAPTPTPTLTPTPTPTTTIVLPCPGDLFLSCGQCTLTSLVDCNGACPGDATFGSVIDCTGACVAANAAAVYDQCGLCGGTCSPAAAQAYVNAGAYQTLGKLNEACTCQDCQGTVNATFADTDLLQTPSGLDHCNVCYGSNNATGCFTLSMLRPNVVPFDQATNRYQFTSIGGGFTAATTTSVNSTTAFVVPVLVVPGQIDNTWTPFVRPLSPLQPALLVASFNVSETKASTTTGALALNVYANNGLLSLITINGAVTGPTDLIAITTTNAVGDVITLSGVNLLDMTAYSTPTCFLTYTPGTKVGRAGYTTASGTLEYTKVTATWDGDTTSYSCDLPGFTESQEVLVNFAYGTVYNSAYFLPIITGATAMAVQVYALAPQVTSVQFSATCAAIELQFDVATSASSGPSACTTYFDVVGNPDSGTASLGSGSNCSVYFGQPSLLRMYIKADYLRDLTASLRPVPGSSITLLDNVLKQRNATYSYAASGTYTIALPATVPTPNLAIEAADYLGPCNQFVLTIASTQNVGGRDIAAVAYTLNADLVVAGASSPQRAGDILNGIGAILAAASATTAYGFVVPQSLLDEGIQYEFTVNVTNFCGGSASRTHTVEVLAFGVPIVVMMPFATQYAYQPLILDARITDPCNQFPIGDGYTVQWTGATEPFSSVFAFPSYAAVSSSLLSLPAYSLSIGTTYDFTLTLTRASSDNVFATTVSIEVVPAPALYVRIAGGAAVTQPLQTPLVLTASILDLDLPATTPSAAQLSALYYYAWVCLQNSAPCTSATVPGQVLSFAASASITVNLADIALPRTAVDFYVSVEKISSGVIGTAAQTVSVLTGAAATASSAVNCSSNGDYLPRLTAFTITCLCATPFTLNVTSLEALDASYYYPLALTTASVAVPTSFTSNGTYSIGTAAVALVTGVYSAVFRVSTSAQVAGQAYAFEAAVLASGAAASVSHSYVVTFRDGVTPTGSCAVSNVGTVATLAYNTTFQYLCTNTETDVDAQPVFLKLRTSTDSASYSTITLALPFAELTTYLPGGDNSVSLAYNDIVGNVRTASLNNETVIATSDAAFNTAAENVLAQYQTDLDAALLLKNLLVFSLSSQFLTLPATTMSSIVSTLRTAFPYPDYAVIGPAVAVVLNAAAETYLEQTLLEQTVTRRRAVAADPVVTYSMVEDAMCTVSTTVVGMDDSAEMSQTCFDLDTLSLLVNAVGQLASVMSLDAYGSSANTNLTACYDASLLAACTCQQRLLVAGEASVVTNGYDIALTCELFVTKTSLTLCSGAFQATLPASQLATSLGATCVTVANNLFGDSTTNTTLYPYVGSNLVALTLTSDSTTVVFNASASATFTFDILIDATMQDYISRNASTYGSIAFLCGYLDDATNTYATDGCHTDAIDAAAGTVTCTCVHTTTYGVLVQVNAVPTTAIDNSISPGFLTLFILLAVALTVALAILGFVFLRRSQKHREVIGLDLPKADTPDVADVVVPGVVARPADPVRVVTVPPTVDQARLVLPEYVAPPSYQEHMAGVNSGRRTSQPAAAVLMAVNGATRAAPTLIAAAADDDDDDDDEEEDDDESEEEEEEEEDDEDADDVEDEDDEDNNEGDDEDDDSNEEDDEDDDGAAGTAAPKAPAVAAAADEEEEEDESEEEDDSAAEDDAVVGRNTPDAGVGLVVGDGHARSPSEEAAMLEVLRQRTAKKEQRRNSSASGSGRPAAAASADDGGSAGQS